MIIILVGIFSTWWISKVFKILQLSSLSYSWEFHYRQVGYLYIMPLSPFERCTRWILSLVNVYMYMNTVRKCSQNSFSSKFSCFFFNNSCRPPPKAIHWDCCQHWLYYQYLLGTASMQLKKKSLLKKLFFNESIMDSNCYIAYKQPQIYSSRK